MGAFELVKEVDNGEKPLNEYVLHSLCRLQWHSDAISRRHKLTIPLGF